MADPNSHHHHPDDPDDPDGPTPTPPAPTPEPDPAPEPVFDDSQISPIAYRLFVKRRKRREHEDWDDAEAVLRGEVTEDDLD